MTFIKCHLFHYVWLHWQASPQDVTRWQSESSQHGGTTFFGCIWLVEKNVPTPFQQHAAQSSLFLGVLCGGVCVSLTLRLYDNSAGCLLAMKEEHMENDPWNGLLHWCFAQIIFGRSGKYMDICGHIVNDSNQPFTSHNLSPHLWAASQLWKRLKVWSMQGELGESTCLFAEFERGREHFPWCLRYNHKMGLDMAWHGFTWVQTAKVWGYIWWNQLTRSSRFLMWFPGNSLRKMIHTGHFLVVFDHNRSVKKKQRTPWIWPGACATCPESFGQRLGN